MPQNTPKMATPQLLSRKTNGHQSISSSQSGADPSSKTSKAKAPAEGEKVVIRRLPPGLTEEEFHTILGDTWKSGNGKVGWFDYVKGKISNDPAKPSRPARAYLHVLRKDDLVPLSDAVRSATWEDAKETFNSPSLIGPPVVEFSIYKKIPSGKRRTDGRQGTIDQDPEFMAFLEGIANPDAAAGQNGDDNATAEEEADKPAGKVKSTPLIESLREKKANKAKETAAAKSAKHGRHESQSKGGKPEETTKKGGKDRAADKPKETVKILTKKAATDAAAEAAKNAASQITAKGESSRDEAASKSRRAGIAAAARILQRDLGLSPGNAHRKARLDAAKAESEAKTAAEKATASAASNAPPASPTTARPTTPVAPKGQSQPQAAAANATTAASSTGRRGRRGRGGGGEDTTKGAGTDKPAENAPKAPEKTPVILLKKRDDAGASKSTPAPAASTPAPATSTPTSALKQPPSGPKAAASTPSSSQTKPAHQQQQKKPTTPATPTPGATRAFVKHANPSQGVTEPLLKQAMSTFGDVKTVEIDKRKGYAYVDFADAGGLAKAMAASPVSVGAANVVVLERKEKEVLLLPRVLRLLLLTPAKLRLRARVVRLLRQLLRPP
ncbi:Smg-4/UPF3 family-domain-containing protein [Coniochaeta sp. 2T2.1]|nr:Smg-4/UPF3 family-domain-containing protein [Coniochaeta sp. 2T2.1]